MDPKQRDTGVGSRKWPADHAWQLFLYSALLILILLPLFQQGTFIDGMLYKTVAYNYAEGLASFWQMKFTSTCMSVFCEQPPLYFYLLGLYYQAVGTHYPADRFFTLFLGLVLVFLLLAVCRTLFRNPRHNFYLVIFLLLSIPVFCWSYANQVIEPMVCVWVALGLLAFVRGVKSGGLIYALIFTAALFLAFLTKGFQSCFFIGLPLFYLLARRSRSALWILVMPSLVLMALLWALLVWHPPAAAWYKCYFNSRLVLTMQDVGGTTDHHLEIVLRFFTELALPLLLSGGLLFYLRRMRQYPLRFAFRNFAANPMAVALLLTSFLGSLPYAISLVQRGFYLLPAFVLFVMALVLGFRRYWIILFGALGNLARFRATQAFLLLLALAASILFITTAHSYKRDETLLEDIQLMTPHLSRYETVSIDPELWNYTSLHALLYLEKQVSLSADDSLREKFIVSVKLDTLARPGYTKLEGTQELNLYLREK